MNSKKRAFLKKKAHNLEPIVRIGKDGLNQNIVQSILDAIASRELIKVKILQNCEEEKTIIYFLALKRILNLLRANITSSRICKLIA